ncbi:bleomycin resistance protein [Polaromonas sp.]|uniref:bleomycin resistance protein n=1 Tax=Polaromonas sp. TaxID=1869339 RepID=UPI003BAB4E42
MSGKVLSTVPILASLDLAESIAFYTGKLGFVLMAQMEGYAILGRDGCEIHFYACDNALIAENTACYVRTPDTDALYEEFRGRGTTVGPPEVRPWGMRELYVLDPHGNLLKFGEPA